MKYVINEEQDIQALDITELEEGDIIEHKPYEFAIIQGLFKKHLGEVELFPCGMGTAVFTLYGHNCSAIKSLSETE